MNITFLPHNIQKKDIFAYILTRVEYNNWHDIFAYINKLKENEEIEIGHYKNLFLTDKDVIKLEDIGLDLNYIDGQGNNLFSYIYMLKAYNRANSPDFFKEALDYITSKTDNKEIVNNKLENVLFYILSYKNIGLNGEGFFELINNYPKINLFQFNNNNQNLLNIALDDSCPHEVVTFLIEKGLSIGHLCENKKTLLHKFYILDFNENYINIFNHIFDNNEELINQKDRYNETPLESLINIYIATNVSNNTSNANWVEYILEKIDHSKKLNKEQTFKNVLNHLSENYQKDKDNYDEKKEKNYKYLSSLLSTKIMQLSLSKENKSKSKNNKI